MRDKWDVIHHADYGTYGEGTISKALEGCKSFYADRLSDGCEVSAPQNTPPSVPGRLKDDGVHVVTGMTVSFIVAMIILRPYFPLTRGKSFLILTTYSEKC